MPKRRRLLALAHAVSLAIVVVVSMACNPRTEAGDAAPLSDAQSATRTDDLRVIQHAEPRRDVVGPRPAGFRWSPIQGADRYAIGLWDEADRLLWRQDDVEEPHVTWPEGLVVGPGTYFWSVSALQSGREIAKSGMAAFVVE